MFVPIVASGMKQPHEFPCFRSHGGQIGALVGITIGASERQVFERIVCDMLLCQDVLDVK